MPRDVLRSWWHVPSRFNADALSPESHSSSCWAARFNLRPSTNISTITLLQSINQSTFNIIGYFFYTNCRPPDIHVGGFMFYHGFFLLSFFRQLPAELAKRNWTISGHMIGSKCNFKMHVWNVGYPFSLQISNRNRVPKTPFSTISELKGNFNSLYLWNEIRYMERADALQTTRGLLHSLNCVVICLIPYVFLIVMLCVRQLTVLRIIILVWAILLLLTISLCLTVFVIW